MGQWSQATRLESPSCCQTCDLISDFIFSGTQILIGRPGGDRAYLLVFNWDHGY